MYLAHVSGLAPTYISAYVILYLLQDVITHKLALKDVVAGLGLVNKSTESIKVVLLPDE